MCIIEVLEKYKCRDGGIGRHEGLKIPCQYLACGFDPRSRHKIKTVLYIKLFFVSKFLEYTIPQQLSEINQELF